ncbi:MAG: sugar phosphate nucleotidyltransferase [Armatimonadota bacterium]
MQAIILAGGHASRLRRIDSPVPKPMLPLFDRPLLEHMVSLLARHGISDIIATVSHQALDIARYFGDGRRFGVRIRYSIESEPLGTAGALRSVQHMITDEFLVIPGDLITDIDLSAAVAAHRSSGASATLLTYEADDPSLYTCLAIDSGEKVLKIAVKPDSDQLFGNIVSTGIRIFDREIITLIPPFESRDIDRDVIPRLLHNGEPVQGFRARGYWCDAGYGLSYKNAHFDALSGALKLDLRADHIGDGVWLGERVEVHPEAEIKGPAYVGAGTIVKRGATVGERAVIGEDTLIEEGAHISHSIVGAGCLIGKEASIIGCVLGPGYRASEAETALEETLIQHVEYARFSTEPAIAEEITNDSETARDRDDFPTRGSRAAR